MRRRVPIAVLALAPALCPADPVAGDARKLERLEVTGSNIKRTETEGAAPLLILRREDLDLRAGQNLQEILIGLPYANFGSFAENRNVPTAGVSLRGLGADSTLVLLNGRRVALNGTTLPGGIAYVNLNSIPTTAIERIEVLKDGASAIYGSDAVAGVINVVLRKDFVGAELAASFGESSRGDTGDSRVGLTAGHGQLSRDGFNAMLTLEYYHRERLDASQRERSRTADQRSRGGADWRQNQGRPGTWLTAGLGGFTRNTPMPGCPAEALDNALILPDLCAFNENEYLLVYPGADRKSVFGRAAAALAPGLTAFAEASWNQAGSEGGGVPVGDQFTLPVDHKSNPFPFPVQIFHRWLELGRRFQVVDSRTTRVVAGIEGSSRGIDFEAAVNRVVSDMMIESVNNLRTSRRNALRDGGAYDFVNPRLNDPALLDGASESPWRSRRTAVESIDARASGSVFELPGGPLHVAAGFERRRERLSSDSDPEIGYVNFTADSHEAGSRTVTGIFAETIVPLHRTVEAQFAVRREHYGNAGESTAPKVALAWRPSRGLLLRAGYTEGFRAPSLYQLHLDRIVTTPLVDDPVRCAGYNAAFGEGDPRAVRACAQQNVRALLVGNPALEAEESSGRTLGLLVEPLRGLSIAIDAFDIRRHGRAIAPSFRTIVANEDSYPGAVLRNPPGPDDLLAGTRGPLVLSAPSDPRIGVAATFLNLGSEQVRGADVELRWRLGLGSGTLRVESLNTWLTSLRSGGVPGVSALDFTTQAWTPRYRGWHSGSWSTGPWTASVVVNAVGRSVDPSREHKEVASWTTFDLQASYAGFRGLLLTAGVRNAADREPPFFDDVLGFDETTHSLVGRFFYLRATFRFR